jgi:hypothetical protein
MYDVCKGVCVREKSVYFAECSVDALEKQCRPTNNHGRKVRDLIGWGAPSYWCIDLCVPVSKEGKVFYRNVGRGRDEERAKQGSEGGRIGLEQ